MKERRMHIGVLIAYSIFAIVCYWTLLSGHNLMKYDIWQAEYPNQVMMTDAIHNGELPLWNPLMNMGMPYYASVGTPIWYPITLLLACIGYSPWTISFEYVIHLIVGAYGCFLLINLQGKSRNKVEDNKINVGVSFVCGLIYCSSGLFLSNAQHIMIIISAAWIPYVFYFAQRYLEEKRIYLAMLSGACAGMIMLGGYPELFCDLFIILIPYYIVLNWKKENSIIKNIGEAFFKYILLCIFTVLASAVTCFSFIQLMPYMTRTAGVIQMPMDVAIEHLLSILLPRSALIINKSEVSMCNFYIGILTVITLPVLYRSEVKHKKLYLSVATFSFIMSLGTYTHLYEIFQKYFPMYAAFRFCTVFRVFICIFLLMVASDVWKKIFNKKIDVYMRICSAVLFLGGIVLYFFGNLWKNEELVTPVWISDINTFYLSVKIFVVITGMYFGCFIIFNYIKSKKIKIIGMIVMVCIELYSYIYAETPITIATYDQQLAENSEEVKQRIEDEFDYNKNRNKSNDFSEAERTSSGLNSQKIVFDKSLDDEGYLSIKLATTENYKNSYNHSITEANPEAYFTSDVVSGFDVELNEWLNKADIPESQIYVETPTISIKNTAKGNLRFGTKEVKSIECSVEDNLINVNGTLDSNPQYVRYIKIYLDGVNDKAKGDFEFEDLEGNIYQYSGEYEVYNDCGEHYAKLYFPNTSATYTSIKGKILNETVNKAQLIYAEKTREMESVNINSFGYNNISLDVDANESGYLTVLQSNYPGWIAYVDGEEKEIETVNGTFIGIALEKGKHVVELKFRPIIFYVGSIVTVVYYIMLFVVMGINLHNSKRRAEK